MDRNQFIGLILMFGLLAVYLFFAPETPVAQEEEQPQASAIEEKPSSSLAAAPLVTLSDSAKKAMDSLKYGVFSHAIANEALEEIETNELLITFSNQGGQIKRVILKNHLDYLGNPLILVDQEKTSSRLIVNHAGKKISLADLAFQFSKSERNDTTFIDYTLVTDDFSITNTYSIPSNGYEIGHMISSKGLNTILDPIDVNYNWNYGVVRAENNLEDSRYNCNIRYLLADGDYDELPQRSSELEEESLSSPIDWISFKQKFFTTGIIPQKPFKNAYLNSKVDVNDTSTVKNFIAELTIPYTDFINGYDLKYYFGPTNYAILKKVTDDFEENVDMGWGPLPLINKYLIIPIFHFLEGFLSNYGLIIFIIVIIIRLILSPLTYKSHIGMAKMRVMKPELDEIKEKHDGDMQKVQQEQMALYQKVGINPLSGCIPLLLQMPILFSLFFFFPNAVELRQQAFLWAHDLSTYDSIIKFNFEVPFYGDHVSLFTLLMTASTILITYSNSQMTTIQGPMKTMQYIMPIMFLFVLNSYASGLTFYYFVSNLATYGQTLLFRKFVDEGKIRKALDENRKKNATKKKSGFQQRLEDAMKASQEAQKAQKSKQKKKKR